MKNREEGDCTTYSLFYAKVQLCSKNNFSPCSKHFGIHFHINKNMIKRLCDDSHKATFFPRWI